MSWADRKDERKGGLRQEQSASQEKKLIKETTLLTGRERWPRCSYISWEEMGAEQLISYNESGRRRHLGGKGMQEILSGIN